MNLATSRCVEDVARERGCEVIRTRIGEINVAEAMLKSGAVVGGENTGGVIVPRIHPCRDSFTAMGLMLERMAITGKSVSALRGEIPSYVVVKDKIRMRTEQATEALRAIRRTLATRPMSFLDGLFVEFDKGWVHVRRSNTEPVLRITAEARTKAEAEDLAAQMSALATRAVS
jgi:phosphomannomutase